MKKALRLSAVIIATMVMLIPFVSVTALHAQQSCWDDGAVQAAVSSGQIQPISQVLAREGISGSTQVLSVKVCEQGGAPVYVVAVLEASGSAKNLTLRAN